ncbi:MULTISPECIES: type II secretion system protein GspM [unclassified Serratia (in: enterobacteria)]|uniref:type II secretion system protein GspM n=1 Tax=unclassified Serratia (in: enterobacteria) TaxID=2647522 RepID=UPI002ED5DFEC|nr:type II secretion system protein GspM [Serratia sp. C2(2)]MEE4447862.1 type II secretion system protein GspM [Serratia sp. C2(1)]
MNVRRIGFGADKSLQAAVALSLLLLAAFSYCLYQFYQMKKNAQQLVALNGQMNRVSLLQSRLPPDAVPRVLLQEHLRQSVQKNKIPVTAWDESEEGVQMTLASIPFAHLMLWLAELQREQGIRVVQLAVERSEQDQGVVKVSQLLVAAQQAI